MSDIPVGPTRYDVIGPESEADHEAVYQFIEVLSGPSTEATNAIVAHGRLLNRLSRALERIAKVEAERDAACGAANALAAMASGLADIIDPDRKAGAPWTTEEFRRWANTDAAKEASCPTP
jgi:hypothetical protein